MNPPWKEPTARPTDMGDARAMSGSLFVEEVAGPPAGWARSRSGKTAWLVFDKNAKSPSNSQLRLTILKNGKPIKTLKYRSGSGNGSTNDCATSQGWLPNGRYDMKLWSNYQGSVVKGRALQLEDKKCSGGGTTRTELFVHTSDPWSDNRYFSEACVKLSPSNIDTLYRTLHYHFPQVKDGGKLPFQLKVIS